MILNVEGEETLLEAISRETMGRIAIQLNETHDCLLVGDKHDQEVLELDQDQILELIEELTELASHIEEVE